MKVLRTGAILILLSVLLVIAGGAIGGRGGLQIALFMAVFAVGLMVIVDAHSLWQVFLFAACLGIGFGGGLVCLMAILSNYYGTRAFASLAGLAIAINTTLSAIAPKVAGRLFDQGIGYGVTFYFLAAWCFVAAVALFFAKRPSVKFADRAAAAPA